MITRIISYTIICHLALTLIIIEGNASARQYSWRFAPASSPWRYNGLEPSSGSYRNSRTPMLQRDGAVKRERDVWSQYYSSSCKYTCDDGSCLQEEYLCDGYAHCWDGTDERNCSCANIIDQRKVCDGYKDCPGGQDEMDCVYGCSSNEFTCDLQNTGSKVKCIPLSKRCDGNYDCPYKNDEEDCYRVIDPYEYQSRGVRSKGILQKRMGNSWYTVCKTTSGSHYVDTYANKACEEIVGKYDGKVTVRSHSLITYKLTSDAISDLRYVRLSSPESTFNVLAACTSGTVYEVECPPPQCGGLGNGGSDYYRRRREVVQEEEEEEMFLLGEEDEEDADLNLLADEETADEESVGEMIVGGYDAQEMGWPYLVGIFKDGEFYCGGSIINERWILTAAHCCHGYEKHVYEVQAGMTRLYSWSPYEQTRGVLEIHVHEGYDHKVFANDIALYKLDEPLYFSKYVTPSCLPTGNYDDPKAGDYCRVAGWGDLQESGSGPDHMQEVALPVLTKCLETFTRDTHQICAGWLEGGKDACQGDSGGPLMCLTPQGKPMVSGVVSFGRGCARENEAGAYTRVSAYLDWIEKTIGGDLSDSKYGQPKQCYEKCHKSGGECMFVDNKCSGHVDCLTAEDETDCSSYHISRSSNGNSKTSSSYSYSDSSPPFYSSHGQQQQPSYYHQSRARNNNSTYNNNNNNNRKYGPPGSRPPNVAAPYRPQTYPALQQLPYRPGPSPYSRPPQVPFLNNPYAPMGPYGGRAVDTGVSRDTSVVNSPMKNTILRSIRKTEGACAQDEIQCGAEVKEGVRECFAPELLCDRVSHCANGFDEVNCFALTKDFALPLGSLMQMNSKGEVKGYVLTRSQGVEWNPLTMDEWTLEMGQILCDSVLKSKSSSNLLSLETVKVSELAKRLPSTAANLKDATFLRMENIQNNANPSSSMTVTKVTMGEKSTAKLAQAEDLTLGFVRCAAKNN